MANQTNALETKLTATVAGATGDELQSAKPKSNGKGTAAGSVGMSQTTGNTSGNLFDKLSAERQAALAAKAAEQGKARQLLAEAADLDKAGNDQAAKAVERAAEAGNLLFQSLVAGRMDREETTSILGEYYGFRRKGDAKVQVPAGAKDASKTPFGRGEEIRKRTFRLLRAHEYVNEGTEDRFFAGDPAAKVPPLPEKDVEAVLTAVSNGKLGFWYSYDKLAEVRRKANEGRETNVAYNVRTINAIRAGIAENVNAARGIITKDPVLLASYVALQDVLNLFWQLTPAAKSADKAN